MIVTFVNIWVKEEYIDAFIKASRENHLESIKESGNLRFDILRDPGDPSKFVFYEAYTSEEYADGHKKTPHYLKWRDTVADWMARPREGVRYNILYPENELL
ncbi:MAG: antibiotic biosynthesis monooxygenase [Bacteroidales bacterium]|nr:antibiotic biosynthesis monooxygenase [Bacteroidales bacterium]